jgi:hypothetical protein
MIQKLTPFERDLARQRLRARARVSPVVDDPAADLDGYEFELTTASAAPGDVQTSTPAAGKSIFDEATNRELTNRLLGRNPAAPANVQTSKPTARTPAFDEMTASDEELKAHFAATPALRDEFSSEAAYVAYVKHCGPTHPRTEEALAADNRRMARELQDLEDKATAVRLTDAQLRQRFASDRALQTEFSSAEAYVAYMRHQREVAQSRHFQESVSR